MPDYGQMVNALLGALGGNALLQPVGDVLPFARRNPGFLNQTEGARPYYGGAGRGAAEVLSDRPGSIETPANRKPVFSFEAGGSGHGMTPRNVQTLGKVTPEAQKTLDFFNSEQGRYLLSLWLQQDR